MPNLNKSAAAPVEFTRNPRRHACRLLLLTAACGVAGQLLFSNDWCLYTAPAALLALFVYAIFVTWLSAWPKLDRTAVRLIVAVMIGLSSGAVFRVIPSWAFHEAFGIAQPAGIRDLRLWRHYEGGPGEHSLIFEFTADKEALAGLIARFPHEPDSLVGFVGDEARQSAWRDRHEWIAAYDLYGGAFHPNGRRTWERLAPLHEPRLFFRGRRSDTNGTYLLMLWEESTGRVVVLHSRG